MLNKRTRIIIAVAGVLLGLFMLWYFIDIVVYIIIAAVLSLMGQPIVELLSKLHIGRIKMPKWLSALITLVVLLGILVSFVWIFVPLISRQAAIISNINVDEVVGYFAGVIQDLQELLISWDVVSPDQTLEAVIEQRVSSLINFTSFSHIVSRLLSATGTVFIGLFSVLFLSFFFLRDRHLLKTGILLFSPDRFQEQVTHVLHKTKIMLSRYFIGLMTELITMATLITIGLTIFGIENALLIGFLGGLMNVIPYLGPIIGASIGVVLGVSSALSIGMYDEVMFVALEVVGTFAVANLIDNMVLQPLIYSRSVYAHPIEIFLVILMAGSLAGIPGMILAIPSYTVLRIVAKEFLSGFKVIDKLTENI
jgi:predicted PurR-regulated permease PerM